MLDFYDLSKEAQSVALDAIDKILQQVTDVPFRTELILRCCFRDSGKILNEGVIKRDIIAFNALSNRVSNKIVPVKMKRVDGTEFLCVDKQTTNAGTFYAEQKEGRLFWTKDVYLEQ